MYEIVPTWVLMVAIVAVVLIATESGFRIGKASKLDSAADYPTGAVQAAAFTLMALLLGFSFSMALSRFDGRRSVTLREANSIGTTALRSDLLDVKTGDAMRKTLRSYVAARIAFAAASADVQARNRAAVTSDGLQKIMWRLAVGAARHDPHSTLVPLFVQSLNETIDLSGEQDAALRFHIPGSVLGVLVLISAVSAVLMGFGFGRKNYRGQVSTITFAVMLALALGIIVDLDRPQRGFIRVGLEPLQAVARSLR
ncbi:MAG: hypothetical protein ABI431_09450 [Candidatus Tumulicola sp.]